MVTYHIQTLSLIWIRQIMVTQHIQTLSLMFWYLNSSNQTFEMLPFIKRFIQTFYKTAGKIMGHLLKRTRRKVDHADEYVKTSKLLNGHNYKRRTIVVFFISVRIINSSLHSFQLCIGNYLAFITLKVKLAPLVKPQLS